MDREKAIEIHKLLLDLVEAYSRAELAIGELDREDRVAFANQLGAVSEALHWELLPVMYRMYPDLQPPSEEPPHIISTLRWEEVSLPPTVTAGAIDQLIISCMKQRWQKTAMVVGNAVVRSKEIGLAVSDQIIAARIEVLVEAGFIENQGDVRKWRHSEVRLKSEGAARPN
ncbi:hypothetical protein J6524_28035 [Bradyrhizobium sp. WSM 1738]|uniref:DUF3658 domain-containing protein n=1 Tax=Bradyrhizobium hereditatis TaxID=2821405 RepID=UPI001CE38D56|nr:DUF3658 domain-containing protein [Bradyrhizobium hereditatis]MCA6118700.1 hypothetical protein [Bradyrhizobium hereditatis]